MSEIDGLCFSCRDQMEFQFYGQTLEYDPNGVATDYLDEYRKQGAPTIKCELCSRKVRYEKQILNGRWKEIEVEGHAK